MMFDKLKDWKDKGLFAYYGAGWNDNQKPFEEGKVAFWIGSSGSFGGLQKTATMPFSATFLPYWGSIKGAGTNSFIGGAALFAMSGKSEAENKCVADFFQFLTSPEIQVFYHKATGYVAITKAAYERPRLKVSTRKSRLPKLVSSSCRCRAANGPRVTVSVSTRRSAPSWNVNTTASSPAKSRRRTPSTSSRRKATTFWPVSPRRPADRSFRNQ